MLWDAESLAKVDSSVEERRLSDVDICASHAEADQDEEAFLQEVLLNSAFASLSAKSASCQEASSSWSASAAPSSSSRPATAAATASAADAPQKNTPPHQMSPEMIRSAAQKWMYGVTSSCFSVKRRFSSASTPIGREISIVAQIQSHEEPARLDVYFVQWTTRPGEKMNGRILRLDDQQHVICPVNYVHYPVAFADTEYSVVCPAIGARVQRSQRSSIPPLSLRLYRMFQCAINLQTCVGDFFEQEHTLYLDESADATTLLSSSCVACLAEQGGCSCAWCQVSMHDECRAQLMQLIQGPEGAALLSKLDEEAAFIHIGMLPNVLLRPSASASSTTSRPAPDPLAPLRSCFGLCLMWQAVIGLAGLGVCAEVEKRRNLSCV